MRKKYNNECNLFFLLQYARARLRCPATSTGSSTICSCDIMLPETCLLLYVAWLSHACVHAARLRSRPSVATYREVHAFAVCGGIAELVNVSMVIFVVYCKWRIVFDRMLGKNTGSWNGAVAQYPQWESWSGVAYGLICTTPGTRIQTMKSL